MDTLSVVLDDSHPFLLLLSDLKSSLKAFQNEAHTSSVKLLRHSLSTSRALERAHALEHENSVLNNELRILRSDWSNESAETDRQSINQLTLSLRTLNEKLTSTEILLASRTAELTHALGELQRSRIAADTTHQLLACARSREEALRSQERELEFKVRAAEERAKTTERTIEEYANFVRTLEGRTVEGKEVQSNGRAIHLTTKEEYLLQQFSRERENLQMKAESVQNDLDLLSSEHTALAKSAQITLAELKDLRMRLQLHERDDTTATKMVARYMKFSQTQVTQLQNSLFTLSTRHAATLSSLTAQIQSLTQALTLAQSYNERLLSALDNLGNEMMKEGHGRRREVRLRIKLVGREERVLESLRRWLRRAEEGYAKSGGIGGAGDGGSESSVLVEMIQDAKILIDNLDDPLLLHTQQHSQDVRPPPVSGSLARFFTLQSAINDLVEDIQREQAKRIALEKLVVRQEVENAPFDALVDRKEVEGKVDLPELLLKDQSVWIASSVSENTESPLDCVEDPTFSPALPTTNHDMTPQEPELGNAGDTSSTSPSISTPIPTLQSATPAIKITPPLPPDEPTSLLVAESGSEAVETKSVNDDDSMTLEREDSENQIAGGACDNVDSREGRVAKDSFDVNSSAPEMDTDVKELDARATLLVNVPDDETAALRSTEETVSDNGRMVSRNDEGKNVDIQSLDNDMLSSNEMTALVHPQPRPVPALPLLLSSSPSPLPIQSPSPPPEPSASQPLLDDLSKARNRYDSIQRAFHACHVAIEGLKVSFPFNNSSSDVHPRYPSSHSGDSLSSPSTVISNDVLKAIVQRLNDYTEDARVELEIRISDEEVMGRGYEALLMLPGALSSAVSPSSLTPDGETSVISAGLVIDVEAQIRSFIDGTDPVISRAMRSFERKLEDIEHDIVIVKKVLHDPQSFFQSPLPAMTMAESPSLTLDGSTSNIGWSSWIRTPISSRPSTPIPAPAPTFGNIMTSRNTRSSAILQRTASTFGLSLPSSTKGVDLVKSLGLKVPMPDFSFTLNPSSGSVRNSGSGDGDGDDDETFHQSRESPSSASSVSFGGLGLGHALNTPRSRTINTSMYMLGMGMGSSGVVGAGKQSPIVSPSLQRRIPATTSSSVGRGRGTSGSGNVHGSSFSRLTNQQAPEDEEDVD